MTGDAETIRAALDCLERTNFAKADHVIKHVRDGRAALDRLLARLEEMTRWAQQVTDALDGRALPECPDESPARIVALLARLEAVTQERDDALISIGRLVEDPAEYARARAALAGVQAAAEENVHLYQHSSLCALNATGHQGPCTCGAAAAREQT